LSSRFTLNKSLHERTLGGNASLYFLRSRFDTLWAQSGQKEAFLTLPVPRVFYFGFRLNRSTLRCIKIGRGKRTFVSGAGTIARFSSKAST
jgi:hypothetical protein